MVGHLVSEAAQQVTSQACDKSRKKQGGAAPEVPFNCTHTHGGGRSCQQGCHAHTTMATHTCTHTTRRWVVPSVGLQRHVRCATSHAYKAGGVGGVAAPKAPADRRMWQLRRLRPSVVTRNPTSAAGSTATHSHSYTPTHPHTVASQPLDLGGQGLSPAVAPKD
uniref:Uncharacterized protein n=1 Tax=Eutreptiella gymnastica TaxID=73025 RepID=A0A7S1N250_9EUGL|mmetsp:Transcript_107857/g.185970  ORF Transcript_107857/g.185970 Transcript_107857/m.185970 type:complete len:164 (+) Transcript_107857:616-1107(+)